MPKRHPISVGGFTGSLEELATQIAAMRYDAVAELLGHLETQFQRQASADEKRGRVKLAGLLRAFSTRLRRIQAAMQQIFQFCVPHMKDELGET